MFDELPKDHVARAIRPSALFLFFIDPGGLNGVSYFVLATRGLVLGRFSCAEAAGGGHRCRGRPFSGVAVGTSSGRVDLDQDRQVSPALDAVAAGIEYYELSSREDGRRDVRATWDQAGA